MKRITSIAGVRVLPFVQAPKYTPGGMNEVRAIAWHFAQGGGTDTWLTRQDGRQGNNSCHIVVKYDGSIRQLVEFDDASWSLHISYDSGTADDAPDYGIFGLQHVKDALGNGWNDPNRYIVAIEVEGFFQDGPNEAQKRTIRLLGPFLENAFPKAVHLGHRDFQDYKHCPGPTLFRDLLPHAGRLDQTAPTGADDMAIDVPESLDSLYRINAGAGANFYADANCTELLGELESPRSAATGNALVYVGSPLGETARGGSRAAIHKTAKPYTDGIQRATLVYFLSESVSTPYRIEPPVPAPTVIDPNPELLAALNSAYELITRIANDADAAQTILDQAA